MPGIQTAEIRGPGADSARDQRKAARPRPRLGCLSNVPAKTAPVVALRRGVCELCGTLHGIARETGERAHMTMVSYSCCNSLKVAIGFILSSKLSRTRQFCLESQKILYAAYYSI